LTLLLNAVALYLKILSFFIVVSSHSFNKNRTTPANAIMGLAQKD